MSAVDSLIAHKPKIEAGAFELQGMSVVSLALGPDVLGVRMACPHPALGPEEADTFVRQLSRWR